MEHTWNILIEKDTWQTDLGRTVMPLCLCHKYNDTQKIVYPYFKILIHVERSGSVVVSWPWDRTRLTGCSVVRL